MDFHLVLGYLQRNLWVEYQIPQILQDKESTWPVTQSWELWSVLKRGSMNLSPWMENVDKELRLQYGWESW